MKKYAILFSLGKDRPGIVDDVSTLLYKHAANIEDSRMATLGGCFSIMMLLSCDAGHLASIEAALPDLNRLGIETFLREAEDPALIPAASVLPLKIEVTAIDHPGIVHRIVRLLRKHNINISDLNTRVTHAPLSGAPLFTLILEAAVPENEPIAGVKSELEALSAEMNLDLNFIR